MRHLLIIRRIPFMLSLLAGMALWEVVGRDSSPAFLVPLSTTLERLWQLLLDGTLLVADARFGLAVPDRFPGSPC